MDPRAAGRTTPRDGFVTGARTSALEHRAGQRAKRRRREARRLSRRERAQERVHIETLHPCIAEAWRALGARPIPELAVAACDEILARYRERHRAYHTLTHVLECMGWLDAAITLAEEPEEIRLALLYHDAVYDPRAHDNEARSAALFRAHAEAVALPAGIRDRITSLITATSHGTHEGVASRDDSALIRDIDLAILGASPHRYDRYEQQIRREYAHVPGELFREARAALLRRFLETTAIYRTDFFARRLEAQARANLARAVEQLTPAPSSDVMAQERIS